MEIHGLLWQKMPPFSLYPRGYVEISPSSMRYVEYAGARIAVPHLQVRRSLTDFNAACALPSSMPMPAITHMPCGSMKIWPSVSVCEPTGREYAS